MKTCRTLFLGSNQSEQGHSFRGHIGGVVLWDYPRSQQDLLKRPLQIDKSEPVLAMWADFTNVNIFSFYTVRCSVFPEMSGFQWSSYYVDLVDFITFNFEIDWK